MSGILFQQRAVAARPSPNRADVALFVGAIRRRPGARIDPGSPRARAADARYRWLEAGRWTLAENRRDGRPLEELLDVPVPVESWAEFDRLFEGETRPLDDQGHVAESYLGAAVRAFFQEGGRRCYVVRVSDPLPLARRAELLPTLVPALGGRPTGSALDRGTWRGLWHLYGLPEVSFASLPDLPDACAPQPGPPDPLPAPPPALEESFVECTTPAPEPPPPSFASAFSAPRCDGAGYQRWAGTLRAALEGIVRMDAATSLREVQLVAAVPLPDRRALPEAEADLLPYLERELSMDRPPPDGLASAFLQLCYPWVASPASPALPEGLVSPEGLVVGTLARNALTRGTFRSAAGLALRTVVAIEPQLRTHETTARAELVSSDGPLSTASLDEGETLASLAAPPGLENAAARPAVNLIRRVTLVGPSPGGFRLLSDVTTSRDPAYRQAQIGRLVAAVVRAARAIGEANVFEVSDPALWDRMRAQLALMLRGLWRAGALRGASEEDAFQVRCDASTMTRNDLDNGRVIAEVVLDPSSAIERIIVALSMGGGGTRVGRAA